MPLRRALSRSSHAVRHFFTGWRRSIQIRVVVSTVAMSLVVVGAVGVFLLQSTREGLIEQRVARVVAEAETETIEARARVRTMSDDDVADQLQAVIDPIIDRGQARGFAVILAPSIESSEPLHTGVVKYTRNLDLASVPVQFRQEYSRPRGTSWSHTDIVTTGPVRGVDPGPGVVVASLVTLPANSENYVLYHVYPLAEQEETLGLLTRLLLAATVVLVLLLGGVAWLVTRQVVQPVRSARQVAERLAAGQLQERVPVSGEDDLARLAISFNQMASNLQRQIRQLEELSRLQLQFVSDVSHELRTPLTTVRMAGDVLYDARGSFDPVTARAAELLQTEVDRFEELLGHLLEISRFDAGAAVLEPEDVDLVTVVHRVVEATRTLAENRGTKVLVVAPPGPCLAEADVRRVERIVRNLVTNAIDHAERRDVVVRIATDGEATALTVRDHGVGLAPGESAMVFNRFWRADPARARTSGGTGLGLSIALEDAHLHGGWLQAWGRMGAGAQFRLTLPRRAGQELRRSPLPLVPADVKGRG